MSSSGFSLSALNPDGFGVLFEQICSDLRPLRDLLITVGAFYTAKIVVTNVYQVLRAIRLFVLPKIVPWETNLPKRYGKWAGTESFCAGCSVNVFYLVSIKS